MSKKTHQAISCAIDAILTQGAQMLYQSYLHQKLPNDCNQGVVSNIRATFDSLVIEKPKKSQIRRQIMPRPATVDLNCCHKVPIRSKSQIQLNQETKKPLFNTEITNSVSTKQIKYETLRSGKPSISFKTVCVKGQVDKRQEQIRRIKISSDKLKLIHNQNNPNQQKLTKTGFLQSKIKQLLKEGVPYAYDDQGNYIIPDIKTYKKSIQQQSKKKIQKPFTLRYKALQFLSEGSDLQNNSSIKGRKRGYSSINPEKKKKISEDEFTNKHQRQFSAIPFMDVADGVKFVQRQRNIMAEKLRSPTLTREQFVKQSKKTLFKSFMPTSEGSTFRVSVTRPNTNAQSRKSLGIVSTASLNVRPNTSKDRVNINNKQLVRQLIKQDSLLFRKVI